jgi:ParB/RepB/Spo0J family partition protein
MGKRKTDNGGMKTVEMNMGALELRHETLRVKQPGLEKNLLSSLSEQGQQSPVVVVKDGDRPIVIDGHKRIRALKKLKADTVQTVVWEMNEAEALAAHYRMSATGSRNAIEEGWLIEKLHRSFRWTMGEIGKKLLKSKSWVSRRLALVEAMPASLTEDVVSGRVGVHAAATYLLPLTRVNTPGATDLVRKIAELDLTNRQIKELTVHYQGSKTEVKKKIVEDPALYLKVRTAVTMNSTWNEVENRCVKNLSIVGNICVGLVKSLPEALPTESAGPAREAIVKGWVGCVEKFRWLEKTAATVLGAPHVVPSND